MNTTDKITCQPNPIILFCGVHFIGGFMISIAVGAGAGAGASVSRIVFGSLHGAFNTAHSGFNLIASPWARLFKTPIKTCRDAATQTSDELKNINDEDESISSRDSSCSTLNLWPTDPDTKPADHDELYEYYNSLSR